MKKIALFFSFAMAMLITGHAQNNVALNATSTHTGGGATAAGYGPENYNDGIYVPFGLPWGWVSTGDTIEYTWTIPQNIKKIIFRKDSRPMRTCDIEYWDGTQYVPWMSYASVAGTSQDTLDSIVVVGALYTDRLRFANVSGSGNPNFREIEVIDGATSSNDAAVLSVDSPIIFCAGAHGVEVTIANYGLNQIDSVEVQWEINGVAQPTYKYIGLLDTIGGSNPYLASINLGLSPFNAGSNTVKAWTSLPNGIIDTVNTNDTILVTINTAAAPTLNYLSSTLTSATFTVGGLAAGASIEYEYGPFGFTQGSGMTASTSTFPFAISGLSQGSAYEIYIRTDCGGGDQSSWVGPISFNTAFGVPFFEDFETFSTGIITTPSTNNWSATAYQGTVSSGFGWEAEDATGANENSSGTGPFYDHTNFGVSGGFYAYMETSGGTIGDPADLITPPVFVDPTYSVVKLSFWYFMKGVDISQMEVIIDTNGVENSIITYTGEQQANQTDDWLEFTGYISGYAGQSISLKFRGINVDCCSGDIAVDDISLTPVPDLSASLNEIVEPKGVICQSTSPIVAVENTGINTLTSVDVVVDVNGTITSTNFTVNIPTGDTAHLSLPTFTLSPGVNYDVKFYTANPNTGIDGYNGDDTLTVNGLQTGLAGAYTIDSTLGSTPTNFLSFSDLARTINTFGICGPVDVTVAPGTYEDIFALEDVTGLSAASRLTIDGVDSALVTLTNPLSPEISLIDLDGASYVTVKNMTLQSPVSSANRWGVRFSGGASYDSLINLQVLMSTTTTTSVRGIGATASRTSTTAEGDNASFITVMNCYIEGAERSVHFEGPTSGNWNSGNTFLNNTLYQFEEYGFYFDQQDSLRIEGNHISGARSTSTTSGYGIANFDGMNFKIKANNIQSRYYGIYCTNANSGKDPDGFAELVNNMVSNELSRGIYLTNALKINVFHNSVNAEGVAFEFTGVTSDSIDFRNNVLVSANDEALDIGSLTDTLLFLQLDYNVYNTLGSDLIYEAGTAYADLASYQTAQPLLNINSLEADPEFFTASDLHIIGGTINDIGDNSVFVLTDIDGDARPMSGSTNVDPGADEFDPPSCLPPTNLLGQDPTLDGFTVTWNGVGSNFEYLIVPQGADPSTGTYVVVADDSVTVSGLLPSTGYDVYVREACGRGVYSLTVGPLTIRTLNGIPYSENFEGAPLDAIANSQFNGWTATAYQGGISSGFGWETEDASGANENSTGTGPLYDHTQFSVAGGFYAYMETSGGTTGDTAELVSPLIVVSNGMNTLKLDYWYFNFGNNIDRMDVYVRSNGTDQLLASHVGDQQTAQTDEWLLASAYLTGYAGQSIQIVVKGVNVACCTGDIAIDDISITEPPANDAGILGVVQPQLPICVGTTTPVVDIRNFGGDTLRDVWVVWDVNGSKDSIQFNGLLAPGDTIAVPLGSVTFNAGTTYNISLYTNNPNSSSDADNSNDTLHLMNLETGIQGNYTIDSSQVTGGSNFQSFSDFARAINTFGLCGTVNVDVVKGSGPYTDQLILENVLGTGTSNPININGHGESIVFAPSVSAERAVIILDGMAGVSIDSLNVDADQGGTYGWGVLVTGASHHISFSNAEIRSVGTSTSTNFACFVMSGSRTGATTDSEVENLSVSNCNLVGGYYALALAGTPAIQNKYISATNNIITDQYVYGILTDALDSSLVEGNDISRPNRSNTGTYYGIYQNGNENTIVNRNAIHNTHDQMLTNSSTTYPIYTTGDASSGVRNLISNNLVYNINNNGTIYGVYDLGSDGANYVNNTISLDNVASTGGTTRGIYQSAASSSSSFVNNIVSITRGGSGTKHGIYLNSTATNMFVDYNNVYMNSAGSGNQSYGNYGGDQVDLATWQLATPTYGVNSQEVDPDFVNILNDDYSPGNLAVMLNNTALSIPEVPEDFYGVARPASPDFGAIEFTPLVGNNLAMRDFLAPAFNADSCYGSAEDVVVSIVNFGGSAIDFTVDTTDLTMNVTGGTTQTLSLQLNDNSLNGGNPLAIGSQIEVNLGSINMSAAGLYSFEGYLKLANDTFPTNDTLLAAVTILAPDGGELSGVDTICEGDTTVLSVGKFIGELQWQEWNGSNWVDIIGQTGTELEVFPSVITEYRVLACGVAPSDTFMVTPIILNTAPIAMGDTTIVTCGDDGAAIASVSSANPNAQFVWFTSATGTEEVDTSIAEYALNANGDSLTYTRFGTVQGSPAIDTFWVAEVVGAGSGSNTIKITEIDLGGTDAIEIQNVSGSPVDVTGWQLAISNNYTDIDVVNADVQTLSGIMVPDEIKYWTDGTTNPWGSNILWDPGTQGTGWAILLDAQGAIVDYVAIDWTAADVMSQNITVGAFTGIQPGVAGAWKGDGVDGTGLPGTSSLYRYGSVDNNDSSDWMRNSSSIGTANSLLLTPFAGGRCESPRAMAIVMVDCVVGIEDGEAITSSLRVYPNPSEGLFTLNVTTEQKENFNLMVRDIKGQLVFDQRISVNGTHQSQMDLSNLAKGVYYLQIQTGRTTTVEKLIIQ